MTAVIAPSPLLLRIREFNARVPAWLGPALAFAGLVAIVAFSDPNAVYGTGREALCYWTPTLGDPYLHSAWNDPIAYVYSPAFLQLLAPIKWLAWPAFLAVWTLIQLGVLRFLTGARWLWLGVLLAAMEIGGGNISLLLAAAIVVGFRYPAAWALVLLTKVTPGVGLLWFAVRREWRSLAIATGATAAIAAASFAIAPQAWFDWADVLVRTATSGRGGTWASIPIPLLVRLPLAIALVVWGARTDRRWTVLVAALVALPAIWYGSLSMLIGLFAIDRLRADPKPERVPARRLVEPAAS